MVVVSARDGETEIRIEERLHRFAGGLFGGGVGGFGTGVGLGVGLRVGLEVLGSALFATVFPLAVIGMAYIGAREIYRAVVRRRRRVIGELLDRLVAEVSACGAEGVLSARDRPPELTTG